MKYCLFIIFSFFLSSVSAKTYYFSETGGDDARVATQAQNSATPWKTLEKLNSYFDKFLPGDSILLKRGDEFFGTINITKGGDRNSPIIIGAYGSGPKPVVTGFTEIKSWKQIGKGIWESSSLMTDLTTLNMVVRDGDVQQIGRYPNINAPNKGYLKISANTGKNSITDIFLKPQPDWSGADAVVRSSQFSIDRAKILSHNGNTLNIGAGLIYEPKYGFGYFIQNHPATLDEAGEWYFDPVSKKLQMYYGNNAPSKVRIASLNNLLAIVNISDVEVENIEFSGANENSIILNGPGSGVSIRNCDIFFSGIDGILSKTYHDLVVEGCKFQNALNEGISATDNTIVKNCLVRNTGFIAGMTQNNAGISAISNSGVNSVTEGNTIINTGYIGIKFGRNNSIVKNNYIDTFCTIKQDGGGIYAQGKRGEVYSGTKIIGNIVLNGIGAYEGTTTFNNNTMGIYCDDFMNNVEIDGNTVAGAAVGLMFHNNRNNIITNNISFNNSRCQFQIISDKMDFPTEGLRFQNNVFISKLPGQYVACYNSLTNDFNSFGLMSENLIWSPAGQTERAFRTTLRRDAGVLYSNKKFDSAFPQLNNSSKEYFFSKEEADGMRLEINPTSEKKEIKLNGVYRDVRNKKFQEKLVLEPYQSIILIRQN